MRHIPSLDGLRAISIGAVLFGHLVGYQYFHGVNVTGGIDTLGVRVFFVISGFLITKLLLGEFAKTGTISIKDFYYRRTLRIFPAYYFFLFVMLVMSALGLFSLHSGDSLHAFTYTTNFHAVRAKLLGHTWSLSVEEQFYLLWPSVLLLFGIRRSMKIAGSAVILAPVVRLIWAHYFNPVLIGQAFPTIMDTISIGCIVAGYESGAIKTKWFKVLCSSPWFYLMPAVILLLNMKEGGRLRMGVLDSAINVLIAITILRLVYSYSDIPGRLLNSRPLRYVGALSYSLYLWQQIFTNHLTGFSTATNLFLLAICSLCSYYLIERPFLALRHKSSARLPVRDAALQYQ